MYNDSDLNERIKIQREEMAEEYEQLKKRNRKNSLRAATVSFVVSGVISFIFASFLIQ